MWRISEARERFSPASSPSRRVRSALASDALAKLNAFARRNAKQIRYPPDQVAFEFAAVWTSRAAAARR